MGIFSIIVQCLLLNLPIPAGLDRQLVLEIPCLCLLECWDSMFSTTSAQLFMWVLGTQTLLDKCFIYLAVSPTWLGHY